MVEDKEEVGVGRWGLVHTYGRREADTRQP